VVPQGSKPVYQSYVVLLPDGNAAKRSELMCCLSDRGIQTAIGTYHMPMTSYFRARYGCRDGDFPATDEVSRRSLTLPLHERLRPEEQEVVVRELMRAVAEWAT
jgi:perosamine synthetase